MLKPPSRRAARALVQHRLIKAGPAGPAAHRGFDQILRASSHQLNATTRHRSHLPALISRHGSAWPSGWPTARNSNGGGRGRGVKGFSLGMKHRLGIAVALLGDSPIPMFDEPVNGLDTEGIAWIGQFLKALAADCHGGHADRFRIAACSDLRQSVVVTTQSL